MALAAQPKLQIETALRHHQWAFSIWLE